MDILAQFDLHAQAVGLDRHAFLDFQLVVLVINQLKTLQDHTDGQHGLLHGELPPDAGTLAVAKGFISIRRTCSDRFWCKVIGVEFLWLWSPDLFVTMQHQDQHSCECIGLEFVFPAHDLILVGIDRKRRRRGPKAQGFQQDLVDVCKLVHLLERRLHRHIASQYAVGFFVSFGEHIGIVHQEVERKGHHA